MTNYNKVMTSSAKVVIVYGDRDTNMALNFWMWRPQKIQRIWVSVSQFDMFIEGDFMLTSPDGVLIFSHQHSEMSGFKQFLQTVRPLNYSDEISLVKLWWTYFKCSLPSSNCNKLNNCPTRTLLKWLFRTPFGMSMSDTAYNLYNAVYAVAHTLHEMLLQVDTWPKNAGKKLELDSWKVMCLIQKGMNVTEMVFLKGTTRSKSMQIRKLFPEFIYVSTLALHIIQIMLVSQNIIQLTLARKSAFSNLSQEIFFSGFNHTVFTFEKKCFLMKLLNGNDKMTPL